MSDTRDARPTEIEGAEQRVLLLVSGERDRELLADRLGDRYQVAAGEQDADWAEFDLCVVDAGTYRTVADDLAARKEHTDAYLPVLLLVPERGETREAEWLVEELGGTVDDVLVVPSPKHELDARVDALLRARRQSRQLALYRRAMDEATLGITITDPDRPDNPIVYANDWFTRLTGYDRDEVIGQNCRFLQGPDTDDETVEEIRAAIDAQEPVTVELLNYRADGEPFWNLLTITPVRDAGGEVTHFLGFQRDVTDRVEAAESLRQEREIIEKVFDTSPVGIMVVDADGNFVRANATAEEVLGLQRSEITARAVSAPDWDIVDVDGESIPDEDVPAARTLATGEPVTDYRMGVTVDGDRLWLSVDTAPLFDQDGLVDGVVASVQDITDRLERKQELERFETIVQTISDAAVIYDETKHVTFGNAEFYDRVGGTPDEVLGTHFDELAARFLDAADHAAYSDALDDVLAGRADSQTLDVEFDLPSSTFVANLNFAPIPGDDGPTGVVVVARDITERVERERDLERYEAIVQATSNLIYVLDPEGHFVKVNDAMVEASGYDREELLGSHASMVADEETVEQVESYVRDLLSGDRDRVTFESRMVFADGVSREFAASLAILREDDEFQGTVIVAHDITDLRESQQRLSVLDRVLRHNLRNRMNVVLGYAQELGVHPDEEVADLGGAIEDSARNLLELSESAREFEQVLAGTAEATAIDVADVLRDAAIVAGEDHPDASICLEVPERVLVSAHETFELAIQELLENAIKHHDSEAPTVEVTVDVDDTVRISIADDGPGLNDIDRRALTSDTESSLEHTQGLGLWLVRWTVDTVGGRLEIDSNEPRGTVITLTLPPAHQ